MAVYTLFTPDRGVGALDIPGLRDTHRYLRVRCEGDVQD